MSRISYLYIPESIYGRLRTYAGLIGSNVHDEINEAVRDFLARPDAATIVASSRLPVETNRYLTGNKLAPELHSRLRRAAFDFSYDKTISIYRIVAVALLDKLERENFPATDLHPAVTATAVPSTTPSLQQKLQAHAKTHGLRLKR